MMKSFKALATLWAILNPKGTKKSLNEFALKTGIRRREVQDSTMSRCEQT